MLAKHARRAATSPNLVNGGIMKLWWVNPASNLPTYSSSKKRNSSTHRTTSTPRSSVCAFFTLSRSFYPSASINSTTSVRADSSILLVERETNSSIFLYSTPFITFVPLFSLHPLNSSSSDPGSHTMVRSDPPLKHSGSCLSSL